MSCQQCQGVEQLFTEKGAMKELENYRKKGVSKSTHLLLDALTAHDLSGGDLIDIGGGVGGIQFALLKQGVNRVVGVDASSGYLAAAKMEAERQGVTDQVSYHFGNFVEIAPQLEQADVVTLDKVICCFDDMDALVDSSSKLAKKFYGLIFPLDAWWMNIFRSILNFFMWLTRNPYRMFVHPTAEVERIVQGHGFERVSYQRKFPWQVIVYAR